MSAEQSHEDLQAGGEGEEVAVPGKGDPPAELTAGKDNPAKSESVGAKNVSLNGIKNGSATAVKSGSVNGVKNSLTTVKTGSVPVLKSGSVTALKSISASGIKNGSTAPITSVSINGIKSGSVTAVKVGSGIESRLSVQQEESKSDEVGTVLEADSSKNEMVVPLKVPSRKKTASEEKLVKFLKGDSVPIMIEEEQEESLVVHVSAGAASTAQRIEMMAPREMVDFSRQVLSRVQHSISLQEESPSMKPSSMAQSGIWSMGVGNQVNRLMSTVIESVAMSHAALLAESGKSFDLSRRGATFVESTMPQEIKVQRSVWRDPDVLNALGKMRLDALGENAISSRENSDMVLPEGLMTQFDIDEQEKEKRERVDEMSRDDLQSILVDVSPTGSVMTGFWPVEIPIDTPLDTPLDIPVDKAVSEEIPTSMEEQRPPEADASREARLSLPASASLPVRKSTQLPCEVLKLTCFSLKDDILSQELSVCSSDIRSEVPPRDVVNVKFRLVTGQVLKRFYRPDTVFLKIARDLSQTFSIAPETIQFSVGNESVDVNACVWDVCGREGTEVLVDADFCPEQVFSLVEKGVLVFDDDEALERFLLRRVPCVPEKKTGRGRSVAETEFVSQPTSFIPGLVDDRERDGALSAELERHLELANCVRCIQSSFQCYLSKRTFAPRKEHSSQQPIKASPADEASCKRNALMKDVNLLTKEDFTVLYNLLGEWWQHEADAIKRNNSSAAKKARLFNLLLTEIDYIRAIEMHRWKLEERRRLARIWELVEYVEEWESFTLWERVELLQSDAFKLCLNCEKCGDDKKAVRAAISRDMNAIIEGKYARSRDAACRRYCYTCHRSLSMWRFKPFAESERLYSCEKCQGLANLGWGRGDVQALRRLIEGVRRGESSRGGCSWLPYIMQEQDFATLAELWHNVSAVSGASCDLSFVRWDPAEEWSPWNTVLLTREEAAVHRIDAYARDFVDTVRKRHLTAKWTFRNLKTMFS